MTLLAFPDVVALALDQLADQLPALVGAYVPAGSEVPDPRPDRFVVVRRVGGTRVTVVTEAAHLAVECWAASAPEADDLAQLCRSVLHAMAHQTIGEVAVYRVDDIGGPADLPDPLSTQPRSPFSVAVHVRGHTPQPQESI